MADFTTQQFEFDFPASGSPGYVEYTGFTTQGFDPCIRGNLSNASARAVANEVWAKFLTAESFLSGQAGRYIKDYIDAAISGRASQASVDAIPTNPVLTDDARLDNLDSPVSSAALEATLIDGVTNIRADIATIDIDTSDLAKEATLSQGVSDIRADIAGLPINPLLADDARLDSLANLDASVSSRSTQLSVDSLPSEIQIASEVWETAFGAPFAEDTAGRLLQIVHAVSAGRCLVSNNQCIIYDTDNVTELFRFDLFDQNGEVTMRNIYDRKRV